MKNIIEILEEARTADSAYKNNSQKADKMIKELQILLQKHRKEQSKTQNISNWGYAGSMGHIVDGLENLVAFLEGNS